MITLFSTHCPKCNVLEKKLKAKNIEYEEVNDVEVMKEKGIVTVPVLEVDDEVMDFKAASDWINNNN
jgi:glutaredoxin-related protein